MEGPNKFVVNFDKIFCKHGHDGIIGMTLDSVLPRFLTSLPTKFVICDDNVRVNGIEVELDQYGKCSDVKRIDKSTDIVVIGNISIIFVVKKVRKKRCSFTSKLFIFKR